ncbi:MAG: glucose-6-phosphate dehydrogenase [Deltaproteobacteria bacterium]|nr:glucose-6-phosphate dehydrogenase [Deltaproteobacteria bacterium]
MTAHATTRADGLQPIVRVRTSDMDQPADECRIPGRGEPCTIVIAGATGDLTARKLMPALFNLYCNDGLPEAFAIVGCGRSDLDDQRFRKKMAQALAEVNTDRSRGRRFVEYLYYLPIAYDDPAAYTRLAGRLKEIDGRHHTGGNRIFYLALPPTLYKTVAKMLGKAGLGREKTDGNGWARLVVEKPFGHDLESAIKLDRSIHRHFREHQVFRIDHYLAKETVQNVLMFRFANAIFEPVWNRRYIAAVEVTATETLGVEHRAGYYEKAGVLRDMFQNHMMQLLALTAMEPPSRFEADRVRDERVKVFRSLRPFPVDRLKDFLVLGQYGRGNVDGKPVPGYREEPDVAPDSLTPTYARMKVFVDNWRWQGIPFILTSGKRLARKLTHIAIQFREVPHSMFRQVLGETINPNRLTLGVYPAEEISLTFQTKTPGPRVCLRNVTMDFFYHQQEAGLKLEAYEKVLLDCMLGDQMLFWRQDAVEQCWSFLTPILAECETCGDRTHMLRTYPAGSWGPEPADGL